MPATPLGTNFDDVESETELSEFAITADEHINVFVRMIDSKVKDEKT